MRKIEMVDLVTQYQEIKDKVIEALSEIMDQASFINGPIVGTFKTNLENYLGNQSIIVPCANGTDALQIAMMGLGLRPGDEVITPAFTYAATAEVIALLGLKPLFVDVDERTFNIDYTQIEQIITPKTKAIIPVHLFGQCANMEPIMEIAQKHHLFVIEDVAQALGAQYTFDNGTYNKAGTIGHVAGTSFFPSKNLGCYGDGGAMITTDKDLAVTLSKIANHGQTSLYYHDIVGVNSRLDSMQAAILNIKLPYIDRYIEKRQKAASYYDYLFESLEQIITPYRASYSNHVFHQYTLTLQGVSRDGLRDYLASVNIPSKTYYPVPLHLQKAYNLNG
ncbi:MAG: DegT/DnrJ/EryC1/StrS family aminotransferase, partial [Flavobacteriales bacterium]|nr:DegT/DnrJ/EryC1/StrS family aminotransferase [Flavobacteriales bacterium]